MSGYFKLKRVMKSVIVGKGAHRRRSTDRISLFKCIKNLGNRIELWGTPLLFHLND